MFGILEGYAISGALFGLAYVLNKVHQTTARSNYVVALLRQGDPQAFLRELQRDIDGARSPRLRNCLLVNKSAGLSHLGRDEEALAVLESIRPASLPGFFPILYYNNKLAILLHMNRLDEARQLMLQNGRQICARTRSAELNLHKRGTLAAYELLCGDREKGREALQELLGVPTPDIYRACRLFLLGKVELQEGKLEQAREKLLIAAHLAPRTHIPQSVGRLLGTA